MWLTLLESSNKVWFHSNQIFLRRLDFCMTQSPFLYCHIWFSIVTNFASLQREVSPLTPRFGDYGNVWKYKQWFLLSCLLSSSTKISVDIFCCNVIKVRRFITSSHFISYHSSQSSCPLVVLCLAIVVLFVLHVQKPKGDFLSTCHRAQLAVF